MTNVVEVKLNSVEELKAYWNRTGFPVQYQDKETDNLKDIEFAFNAYNELTVKGDDGVVYKINKSMTIPTRLGVSVVGAVSLITVVYAVVGYFMA